MVSSSPLLILHTAHISVKALQLGFLTDRPSPKTLKELRSLPPPFPREDFRWGGQGSATLTLLRSSQKILQNSSEAYPHHLLQQQHAEALLCPTDLQQASLIWSSGDFWATCSTPESVVLSPSPFILKFKALSTNPASSWATVCFPLGDRQDLSAAIRPGKE